MNKTPSNLDELISKKQTNVSLLKTQVAELENELVLLLSLQLNRVTVSSTQTNSDPLPTQSTANNTNNSTSSRLKTNTSPQSRSTTTTTTASLPVDVTPTRVFHPGEIVWSLHGLYYHDPYCRFAKRIKRVYSGFVPPSTKSSCTVCNPVLLSK